MIDSAACSAIFETQIPGVTPLMAAYERAERDDILTPDDGEVVWHWLKNGESA